MPTPRTKAAHNTPNADLRGQLAGEYRILRQIGAGGFGTVYEAEHPILKRKAAVKVLHASRTVDQAAVQRFIAEARAATQIRHRHIVDIFSFGKLASGQHFYAMDLLDGAPLDRFLEENKRLQPEVALPLLRPVAQALDAMHAQGLVHRDVKPANIYLAWESNGEVVPKLLDFGLVKLLADSPMNTASGVPMGTPYYMSPEQCRGEKIDPRSDVYAFGVICHELMSGDPPFNGDTPTSVLVAHLTAQPPRLSESAPDLPPELDEPIQRMLKKDRAERPDSVGEAFSELEAAARRAGLTVVDGLPHLPRPSARPKADSEAMTSLPAFAGGNETTVPSGRRFGVAGLAGVFLVLVAGGSLYSLLGKEPASEPNALPSAAVVEPVVASAPILAPVAAPAPAPSATVSAEVEITLKGVPNGASIVAFDKEIAEAPNPVRLPASAEPVELTVVAPGFKPKTLSVVPSSSQSLTVTLTRTTAPRKALSKDLEDPF